ncbi:hypothetical protein JCM11491_004381 [Sporobolomyces phaffii]
MSAGGSSTGFIFSYNADDEDIRQLSAAVSHFIASEAEPRRRAGLGSSTRRRPYEDDEFAPYGPTTYRRGAVRFISGGLLGTTHDPEVKHEDVEGKGKGKAPGQAKELSGNAVAGLYQSIVGIRPNSDPPRQPPASVAPRARSLRPSPNPPAPSAPYASPSLPKEAEIIILSSDSESASSDEDDDDASPKSPPANLEDEDEDDDIVILDPLTNLPERVAPPRRRRLLPRSIHELVGSAHDPVVAPPTHYAIGETEVGYRLLARHGWKAGETLGRTRIAGLKVPLRAVEKFDRKGLGLSDARQQRARWKLTEKEKEEERRTREREQRDERGRGERGMAKKAKMDNAERKAWIQYMNR